jgi:hypothetical protein
MQLSTESAGCEYSEEVLDKAIAAVGQYDSDMGGTEILEPLKYAVEKTKIGFGENPMHF